MRDVIGAYLDLAALLGQRTAEMHLALASNVDDAGVRAERRTRRWTGGRSTSRCATWSARPLRLLRDNLARLHPRHRRARARGSSAARTQVLKVFEPYLGQRLTGLRIRTHGDYHLEQVLYTGKDFVIIDFDGLADGDAGRSGAASTTAPARRRRA